MDLTLKDVAPVFNEYKTLFAGKEHIHLPVTSSAKEYATLHGTIPVSYKGIWKFLNVSPAILCNL